MEVKVFSNLFTNEELDTFKLDAINKLKDSNDKSLDNLTHCISIQRDDIVNKVKDHIESKLNLTLQCQDIQYQVWKIGSFSTPHVHDEAGRSMCDYNTVIYLNDDFSGGEFYTLNNIHKPIKGDITFFDGEHVWHGVKPVKDNDRYTIILWWYNTCEISDNHTR